MDGESIPESAALPLAEVSDQRLAAVDIQVIHHEVDGVGLRVVLYDALHQIGKLVTGTIRCRRGEVAAGLWLHGAEYVGRASPFILIVLLGRFPWFGRDRRAFHRRPARPPSSRCMPRPTPPRTTFFSRHGFKSWLCNKIRIVSRPTSGTSFRLTASSATSRTVQRARPSGGLLQTMATIRCFWESSRSWLGPGLCFS